MATVSKKQLADIVVNYIAQGISHEKVTKMLAEYLVAESRTRELDSIMREVNKRRSQKGVIEATAVSAYPLSANNKQLIKAVFVQNQSKFILNEVIDPNVVGGVRVETTDQQMDLTIRHKLNQLKTATA